MIKKLFNKQQYERVEEIPFYLSTNKHTIRYNEQEGRYYIKNKYNNKLVVTDKLNIKIKEIKGVKNMNIKELNGLINDSMDDFIYSLDINDFNSAFTDLNYSDEYIHSVEEFDDVIKNMDLDFRDAINMKDSNFSFNIDYFIIDLTSNEIKSFTNEQVYDWIISLYKDEILNHYEDDFLNYIIDNNDLSNEDIEELTNIILK